MPEFQSYNKKNKSGRQPNISRPEPLTVNSNAVPLRMPRKRKPTRSVSARTNQGYSPRMSGNITGKRKVRQNYVIHAVLTAILFILIVAMLSVTVLFNADEIIIKGESSYSDEEILAAGNLKKGVNLIRFNSGQAEEDIINSLVCLDGVVVKKSFPSTVTITIEPAERVFSVKNQKTYFEVSQKGRIINIASKSPEGLVIEGLTFQTDQTVEIGVPLEELIHIDENGETNADDIEKIEIVFRLIELIKKHKLSEIKRIDVQDRFDLKMYNRDSRTDRVEVRLGAPTQLDEKLAIAAKIIEEQIEENESGILRVSTLRKASFNPITN
ncbi:MAG: FtsQ-type POTRA domain-containing protein [Oscillospiraceae bacterium]|nr:FtsQ-type POTRA domain-containing protein [Oscillospiraceae bacterium]